MIEIRKIEDKRFTFIIYEILLQGNCIGSIEMIDNFIENIYIEPIHRGKGFLTKIIQFLIKEYGDLECLPLEQHIEKFKHLGFIYAYSEGTDNFYKRKALN